jgi:hypothetical protein
VLVTQGWYHVWTGVAVHSMIVDCDVLSTGHVVDSKGSVRTLA